MARPERTRLLAVARPETKMLEWQRQSGSSTTASHTTGTQTRSTRSLVATSRPAERPCIAKSGETRTARSRSGSTSTIATEIRLTTRSRTSSYCRSRLIAASTSRMRFCASWTLSDLVRSKQVSRTKPVHAVPLASVAHGCGESPYGLSVHAAEECSRPSTATRATVRPGAIRRCGARATRARSAKQSASFAERCSSLRGSDASAGRCAATAPSQPDVARNELATREAVLCAA